MGAAIKLAFTMMLTAAGVVVGIELGQEAAKGVKAGVDWAKAKVRS